MKLIEDVIMQEKEDNKITIDWEKLERVSEDIVGWIKIEGTKIDYPIMKDNNSYKYLKKSFDGKYNKNGSIFTINYNPFEENITTIYRTQYEKWANVFKYREIYE